MGLDQCAYARLPDQSTDNVKPEFIWRKHAKLQEFMDQLFVEQTGKDAIELNCGALELTADDIALLEQAVQDGTLPESPGGFFYGHQFQDESAQEYREQDLAFCKWAQGVLQTRARVFYTCWW